MFTTGLIPKYIVTNPAATEGVFSSTAERIVCDTYCTCEW